MVSSIKVWCRTDNHLEGSFLCQSHGPCSSMESIPWQHYESGVRSTGESWRLITSHDSGSLLLWDPSLRPMRPLLEIETRKSPIRSFVVFESLGLMSTAHKDGSIVFGKLLSPNTQIYGFTGSDAVHNSMEDDGQIYPFVPRVICEDVFGCGAQCAIGGYDCLFAVSNRGAILHFTKEKLQAHAKLLQSSSKRRLPVQAVNKSVMVISRNDVEVGETIYDGDFAQVKKGRFLAMDVIVKEAKDEADSRRAMDAIVKDAHILSNLRHPNIVNIMAVCDNPPFVVMQHYKEGSLYEVLKQCRATDGGRVSKRFTWEKRLTVAIDVCCGMVFLHSQKPAIIHRDLKSPNIFIEKDFNGASVGDFNLSKDMGQTTTNSGYLTSVRPSNPMWLAPEVARGEADFSIATDLYSFGIIMWEILTARTPWDHLRVNNNNLSRDHFFNKIRYELLSQHRRPQINRDEEGIVVLTRSNPKFLQVESYVKLMEECWAEDSEDRPKSFATVVTRLEEVRRRHIESRTRSGSNPSQSDASKKSSADLEDKRTQSDSINPPQPSQIPGVPPTVPGSQSLLPNTRPNLTESMSMGLPRSPFDNNEEEETPNSPQEIPPNE